MANIPSPAFNPRPWTKAQRPAVSSGASLIPITPFPPFFSPDIVSVDRQGNITAPGPDARPEILLPARPSDGHPCEQLDLQDFLMTGMFPCGEHVLNLGLLSQVASRSSCGLCRLIRRGFSLAPDALKQIDFGCLLYPRRKKSCYGYDTFQLEAWATPITLWPDALTLEEMNPYTRLLIHPIGASQRPISNRITGRQRNTELDMNLVQTWLSTCKEDHGELCDAQHLSQQVSSILNLKLINVRTRCVIHAEDRARYVALSYVWGPPELQTFQATTAKLAPAHESTGLCMNLPKTLPPTIEDAMAFVNRLGETYLWVDSLCIIQDSPDKLNQINQMDRIYSNALLTIIAAAGANVNAGLPGIRLGSRHEQIMEHFQSVDIAILPETRFLTVASCWASRAWTYQERILSNRLMYFTANEVLFVCNKAVAREDVYEAELSGAEKNDSEAELLDNPLRDLSAHLQPGTYSEFQFGHPEEAFNVYAKVLTQYKSRRLTNSADILRAIQGVLNPMEDILGNFSVGLPVSHLDSALLWQMDGEQTRRQELNPSTGAPFPSWSWSGWIGTIKYDNVLCSAVNLQSRIHWQTFNSWEGKVQGGSQSSLRFSKGQRTPERSERQENITVLPVTQSRCNDLEIEASFAEFRLHDPRSEKPITAEDLGCSMFSSVAKDHYSIVDSSNNKPVGEIVLPWEWAQAHLKSPIELLALSLGRKLQARLRNWAGDHWTKLSQGPEISGETWSESGISRSPSLAEWRILNVMAVEEIASGRYERRGLGVILVDAWEEAPPVTRSIVLC